MLAGPAADRSLREPGGAGELAGVPAPSRSRERRASPQLCRTVALPHWVGAFFSSKLGKLRSRPALSPPPVPEGYSGATSSKAAAKISARGVSRGGGRDADVQGVSNALGSPVSPRPAGPCKPRASLPRPTALGWNSSRQRKKKRRGVGWGGEKWKR